MPRRLCICIGKIAACAAVCCAHVSFCQASELGEPSRGGSNDRLVVHEWGTFTSLQDEQGEAIAGINGDDEPVPKFVHRISNFLLLGPNASIPILSQGAPHCHPDVTMRLETPVIYFHPSPGMKLPLSVDVEVAFRSGWLSEYYPAAEVEAPGVKGQMTFGPIGSDTIGTLRWKNLQVGTDTNGPETTAPDWLAPRAVQSADVTSVEDESERFLFYRGVGHVDSPLQVARDVSRELLTFTVDLRAALVEEGTPFVVRRLWLVEVRDDKSCAFRDMPGFKVTNGDMSGVISRRLPTGSTIRNFRPATSRNCVQRCVRL